MTRLDELKAQLAQLDELVRSGVLTSDAARKARDGLEAEILATVLKAPSASQAPPAVARESAARPSRSMLVGVATFVLLFAVAGYAWLGNREGLGVSPGVAAAPAGAGSAPHETGAAQMEALAQRLAERLKTNPDDADGWSMLGRSYAVLGRYPQAVQAIQHVIDLRPKDAQAYADYADALGMANGRKLDGEPEKAIARALQLDPDNGKALALAGTVALDHGDAALAARHWERALRGVEPGGEMARQLQGGIAEARQRAGLPPLAAAPSATAPAQVDPATTAAPGAGVSAAAQADAKVAPAGSVQARITLAPALASRAAPDDTVFIFARALQGPKAPLAIQRRQVKDLPLDLVLDDSMAMSPAMSLSTVTQVVIGARVSKSGNAMPQPGDLQGLSPTVAVGARGVQVEIGDVVK